MFVRSLSLILALAIVACPLLCSSGWCAGDCCRAKTVQSELDETTKPVCGACCGSTGCRTAGDDRSGRDEDPQEPPYEQPPARSPCQGICSGAVIEKPVELHDPLRMLIQPAVGDVDSCDVRTNAARTASDDVLRHCCRPHGRDVRTLHASLLC